MLKKAVFIILISVFTLPLISEASYYTIMLKNGNNIDVSHYWDLKSKILFYTDKGKVEIPKIIVSNISDGKGVLEPKIGFYPTEEYFDQLLNRCADEGIDLMVLGAFSQFRRGNQILGDVGRYLLKSMTVPVLMSH